jgi:AMMECR1 domain-containing protein
MKRLRGSSSTYEGFRIADSVIQSTVYAASSRSIGSEISYTETKSVTFKISVIEEVKVMDNPEDSIQIGRDVPIVIDSDIGWIFPTQALEYNWNREELLTKTCKKAGVRPDLWKDEAIVVLKTRTFIEETPDGTINPVDY